MGDTRGVLEVSEVAGGVDDCRTEGGGGQREKRKHLVHRVCAQGKGNQVLAPRMRASLEPCSNVSHSVSGHAEL